MNTIFSQKKINYQLRTANLLNFSKVTTSKYGFNTFEVNSSQLWNQVPDSVKSVPSVKHFKTDMLIKYPQVVCTDKQKMQLKFCNHL